MAYHDTSSHSDWALKRPNGLPMIAVGLATALLLVLIAYQAPQSGPADGIEDWHGNVARSDSLK